MKTKEELNALKNEIDALNAKLAELSAEELAQVIGGADGEVRWITKMVCGYCEYEASWAGDYVGRTVRCPKCNAPTFGGVSKSKL